MTTQERLTAVFRRVFDDPAIELRPQLTANDVDGWDSLSHVNLIIAVEAEFGIRFSPSEAGSFRNVGELLQAVEAKTRR